MLVVSRRAGEWLHLRTAAGEEIAIRISEIDRGGVRLAIDAPREVLVSRSRERDCADLPTTPEEGRQS